MAWHSASLPEASPLDLPVHIFNPSFLTHLSSHGTALAAASSVPWWWLQPFHTHFSCTGIFISQFGCTSFIWIINLILRPALIPQHLLHLAMPCQGQAPGPPSTHFLFQFWYTCLFSLLLLMFYLNYQTYTLACTNGMALTALGQLARGKPLGPPSPHV